jgi:hypothetical protein
MGPAIARELYFNHFLMAPFEIKSRISKSRAGKIAIAAISANLMGILYYAIGLFMIGYAVRGMVHTNSIHSGDVARIIGGIIVILMMPVRAFLRAGRSYHGSMYEKETVFIFEADKFIVKTKGESTEVPWQKVSGILRFGSTLMIIEEFDKYVVDKKLLTPDQIKFILEHKPRPQRR